MKTVEHQTKEMESISYALRTMFGSDEQVVALLDRHDKMVVEVKEAWQDCFNEAANAKCDLTIAQRKIKSLEQDVNYLQASNNEQSDKYMRIREICEE